VGLTGLPTALPTAEQLALAWTRAVARTSHTSLSRRALHAHLQILAGTLLDAVAAENFDSSAPAEVGRRWSPRTSPRSRRCSGR